MLKSSMRKHALRISMLSVMILIFAAGWVLALPSVAEAAGKEVAVATSCEPTCNDYPQAWVSSCPDGERCIEFKNNCSYSVTLSYQVGCDKNGNPGSDQCNCTLGPTIAKSTSHFWKITDANDPTCNPAIKPSCPTVGLAVMVNKDSGQDCTQGTRVEFTTGNSGNIYGKFDSYNIDVEKQWYSVPTLFKPDVSCTTSTNDLDCRPLWCNSADCPDAYNTPTTGGCSDDRSPQGSCQDTFNQSVGYTVELCPSQCATTGGSCPSCQTAKTCS